MCPVLQEHKIGNFSRLSGAATAAMLKWQLRNDLSSIAKKWLWTCQFSQTTSYTLNMVVGVDAEINMSMDV